MKKRFVEFVVGAVLLAAVMLIGCGGSVLPQAGKAIDASSSLLETVCVDENEKCEKARALLEAARRAYARAVDAEAKGNPDAADLIDQAARSIEELVSVIRTF